MKPLRCLAVAAVVAAVALVPNSLPVQAAPAKHTVTLMVTSVEVLNDFDSTSCGDFKVLGLFPTNATEREMDIVPKGPSPEVWNTGLGNWVETIPLCAGSTYAVSQTNLPELAKTWEPWSVGTFAYRLLLAPPTAANLNRLSIKAAPGETIGITGEGVETDYFPLHGRSSNFTNVKVSAPAAGKNGTFKVSINFSGGLGESDSTGLLVRGVISTSATPA